MRTNPLRVALITAAAVAASVLAVGCAEGTAARQHVRTATAALIRGSARCEPAQLRLSIGPRVSEKTQQDTVILRLRNASTRTCWLRGYPGVTLTTARGRMLPFRYADRGDMMLTSARPRLVRVSPGHSAYAAINKNSCVRHATKIARTISLTLTGSAGLTIRLRRYPVMYYCPAPDPGHRVDIAPFEATMSRLFARA